MLLTNQKLTIQYINTNFFIQKQQTSSIPDHTLIKCLIDKLPFYKSRFRSGLIR